MILVTPMYEVFLQAVIPLLALVSLWESVVLFYRGLRMLVLRVRAVCGGLHASGALKRGNAYVPVFSYTCRTGREVDILGGAGYDSEAAALKARRPLVYEAERPDAAMAHNVFFYIGYPVFLLLASCVLAAFVCYLLVVRV